MIFFEKKIIFIHLPRCGGTSIEQNLYFNEFGKYFNTKKTHKENLYMGFVDKYSNKYQLDGLQHLTFENIKKIYPTEIKNFYSFSFVRNPFSRAVSLYCEIIGHRDDLKDYLLINKNISFNSFLKLIVKKPHTHWMPMCKFFDKNELNFVGRFENFKKDLNKVSKKNKLKFKFKNFSDVIFREINYLPFYDNKDNVELVNEIYQNDLNRFNYNFNDFYIEYEKKNKNKKWLRFDQKKIKKKLFLDYIKNYLSNKKFFFFNLKKVLYCK